MCLKSHAVGWNELQEACRARPPARPSGSSRLRPRGPQPPAGAELQRVCRSHIPPSPQGLPRGCCAQRCGWWVDTLGPEFWQQGWRPRGAHCTVRSAARVSSGPGSPKDKPLGHPTLVEPSSGLRGHHPLGPGPLWGHKHSLLRPQWLWPPFPRRAVLLRARPCPGKPQAQATGPPWSPQSVGCVSL